jgi:tripartite ATP-independent transporter DctP family solute receptor
MKHVVKATQHAVLWVLVAVMFLSAPAQAAQYTIRVAFPGNEAHGSFIALERFKQGIEERTDGRVRVDLFPNSQLGSDRHVIESMSIGTLEMVVTGATSLLVLDDRLMFIDLPFLFPTYEIAFRAYDEYLVTEVNRILEAHDIYVMFFGALGYRHITNNRGPIRTPDDLSGIKIRTTENPLHVETFRLFGANPTPVAFAELYTALQQGTVDAQENTISVMFTSRLFEAQRYLSLTGHSYSTAPFMINRSFLENLPADIRTIILEVAQETKPFQREIIEQQNAQFVEEIVQAGLQLNELSQEDRQAFVELSQPLFDAYIQRHGGELLDRIAQIQ